jgi:hypothetical protein
MAHPPAPARVNGPSTRPAAGIPRLGHNCAAHHPYHGYHPARPPLKYAASRHGVPDPSTIMDRHRGRGRLGLQEAAMPGMKVTVDSAMRARDVSRPGPEEVARAAAADPPTAAGQAAEGAAPRRAADRHNEASDGGRRGSVRQGRASIPAKPAAPEPPTSATQPTGQGTMAGPGNPAIRGKSGNHGNSRDRGNLGGQGNGGDSGNLGGRANKADGTNSPSEPTPSRQADTSSRPGSPPRRRIRRRGRRRPRR